MDHRIALKPKTPLCLCNDKGEQIHCVIEKEIGRGGSCIVYEASRVTETGDVSLYRVKEFYPYKPDIKRGDDNTLTASSKDAQLFRIGKERFLSDFSRTNELFYSGANYSSMTNQLDVFSLNGTYYVLSAYSSEKTLSAYQPESLKECVTLVKQVAFVLENIHKHGYLYLDTKPDNILITDGYQKQIQLFDFDSLFSLSRINKDGDPQRGNERLSYSKGFAPFELQTSKVKCLGPHTDVYGVGALLFYLLFGHTPAATDCEQDAVFDYEKLRYDYSECDDRLFDSLNSFFHKALAVYYADRYQNMHDVICQLQRIETHADKKIPRIYSTRIVKPKFFFGRKQEFEELDSFLLNTDNNCLFVTGMGGIGKSTLIRAYLACNSEKFGTVLYVHYEDSIEATVCNDTNVNINTLHQREETGSGNRYFDTKLRMIRELVSDTTSVLVIDDFVGEIDNDFLNLIDTGLKVILVTRNIPAGQSFPEMRLESIKDEHTLLQIFEMNLGRSVNDIEIADFKRIIKRIEGHTLVLELIAKQIANSHITVSGAAELTDKFGFSAIAPEKVRYEKDSKRIRDTIGNIVDAIFMTNGLSGEMKTLLKVASLLGDEGIDINDFQRIMELTSKDDLNELITDGWLSLSGDVFYMHRVIREAVHRWEWIQEYVDAAVRFLRYFHLEIWLESTKNDYPKKLRQHISNDHFDNYPRWIGDILLEARKRLLSNHGIVGKMMEERIKRFDDLPADIKKLSSLLNRSESVLRQCKYEPVIKKNSVYIDLLYVTIINLLEYRDDSAVLSKANELFSDAENGFILNGASELLSRKYSEKSHIQILKIRTLLLKVYNSMGDTDKAKKQLAQAEIIRKQYKKGLVPALYYDMLSEYYDILLNGFYDAETPEQISLLNKMLDAIDKTIYYSKRERFYDGDHLYAAHLLAKATVLMRSCIGTDTQIIKLIKQAKDDIEENTSEYAHVRQQYLLVCAWYYVLMREDPVTAEEYLDSAYVLAKVILPNDLQMIESVIIPGANIYYEAREHKRSMRLLDKGIQMCAKKANTNAYDRLKQELCEHYLEVGVDAGEYELCQKMIDRIEAENEEIIDLDSKVIISDDICNLITSKLS